MYCVTISVAVIILLLVLLVAYLARPAPRRRDVVQHYRELHLHIAQPRAEESTANPSELVYITYTLQDLA